MQAALGPLCGRPCDSSSRGRCANLRARRKAPCSLFTVHTRTHAHPLVTSTPVLQVALFPASRCLAVRAPYSGGQLSVLLAALRAYPLLTDALQQRPGHFEVRALVRSFDARPSWRPCWI